MNEPVINETAERKLNYSKCKLLVKYKLFGGMLFYFPLVEDKNQSTFYTDAKIIGYNSAFIDTLSKPEVAGVILHELMHNFFKHFLRFNYQYKKGENLDLLNMALDYAINSIIVYEMGVKDENIKLPSMNGGLCLDERFKGMNAEKIFKILLEEKKQNPKQSQNRLKNYNPFDDHQRSIKNSDDNIKDAVSKGKSVDDLINEIDQKIQKVFTLCDEDERGTIPGEIQRMIDEYLEKLKGKVDWKAYIRSKIQEIGKGQYSTSRFNKRYVQRGMYFPGQVGHKAKIALSLDLSGSIGQKETIEFLGEMKSMLDVYPNLEILLYGCDSIIQGKTILHGKRNFKEVELAKVLKGGGGTSHFPIFEDLAKSKDKDIKLLFAFTDGYSDINHIPMDLRGNWETFWVLPESSKGVRLNWGQKIIMENKN